MTSSSANLTRVMKVALGTTNLGRVKNKRLTYGDLLKKLEIPLRTGESYKKYLKLSADEQARLKMMPGYWIGAFCKDGKRNRDSITARDSVTFDIDNATPELVDLLLAGLTSISGYEFAVHSTRKHSPQKPRLRIVFPLKDEISADRYMPLARLMAAVLDPTMETVDPVSFRLAQMMYLPSCSADSEYVFFRNPGELVDPEAILATWDGNMATLPTAPTEGELRDSAKRAERPHQKRGIIGAFCRAYRVEEAIDKFIPEVYVPGDEHSGKPRYTYTGGSASNGVVVEDDGLFIYSHHGTDPCSDRLVNAWDMVRIHLYGDLDKGKDEDDTPPTKLASYKAMVEMAKEDPEVRRELAEEAVDLEAMIDDADVPAEDDEPAGEDADEDAIHDPEMDYLLGLAPKPVAKLKVPKNWHQALEINNAGRYESNLTNLAQIIQYDPRTRGTVEYNEFRNQTVTRKPVKTKMAFVPTIRCADPVNGDPWQDSHSNVLRAMLEAPAGKGKPGWGLKVSDRDLLGSIDIAARSRPFHPVREFLDRLRWDGERRVDRLFVDYLGAEDNAYHRETARKFLVAAVARAYEPGHKFDFVPILEGTQGKRKSTFIRVLAMDWFEELKGDFGDEKRLVEQMMGAWILELPELSTISRSTVEEIKAFTAAKHSTVRLSYARLASVFPRQCVFMGSTNEAEYLVDQTGNRRWWPIYCHTSTIDTDRLRDEREQIWAEAAALYREMRAAQPHGELPLYLADPESIRISIEAQEERRQTTDADIYAGILREWLEQPVKPEPDLIDGDDDPPGQPREWTCAAEAWFDGLANDRKPTKADLIAVGKALRLAGWIPNRKNWRHPKYGQGKAFIRKPAD